MCVCVSVYGNARKHRVHVKMLNLISSRLLHSALCLNENAGVSVFAFSRTRCTYEGMCDARAFYGKGKAALNETAKTFSVTSGVETVAKH